MGLVGHNNNVISLGVALCGVHFLIELLDQRENVPLMLGQKSAQVGTAGSTTLFTVSVNHAAAGKSLVDLRIQIVSIGKHQEREIAAELAMDLAGKHHHRIALACTLSMPEDPQLAIPLFALTNRLDCLIDTEILVVTG